MSTTTEPVSLTAAEKGYVQPDVLVTTDWLAQHLNDPTVRILESDEDVLLYDMGHIPGAQKIDWHADLNDPVVRDYVSTRAVPGAAAPQGDRRAHDGRSSTATRTTGGRRTRSGCSSCSASRTRRLLDGGRTKWEQEGRPMATDVPKYPRDEVHGAGARRREDPRVQGRGARAQQGEGAARRRALARRVHAARRRTCPSIRRKACCAAGTSPARGACRGRARRTRTARSRRPTSCARSTRGRRACKPSDDVVAYCRIGERSTHTWFVLTYLLGYDKVRNYDGSWTEWGNSVRLPIEK